MTRGNWSSFYNDQGGFSGSSVRHGKCGWSSEVSPRRQRNREGVARQRAASFPLFQSREAAKHISPMVTRHGHDEFRTSRCHTVSMRQCDSGSNARPGLYKPINMIGGLWQRTCLTCLTV